MDVKKGVVKKIINMLLDHEIKKHELEHKKVETRFHRSFESLEKLDEKLISKYAVFEENGDIHFRKEDISRNGALRN